MESDMHFSKITSYNLYCDWRGSIMDHVKDDGNRLDGGSRRREVTSFVELFRVFKLVT